MYSERRVWIEKREILFKRSDLKRLLDGPKFWWEFSGLWTQGQNRDDDWSLHWHPIGKGWDSKSREGTYFSLKPHLLEITRKEELEDNRSKVGWCGSHESIWVEVLIRDLRVLEGWRLPNWREKRNESKRSQTHRRSGTVKCVPLNVRKLRPLSKEQTNKR